MIHPRAWLRGVAFGAGLMYFLDPERGRRRRALARNQALHLMRDANEFLDTASRDLQNRAEGWIAEANSFISGGQIPDDVLVERVRSKLGRCVSHPRAIQVKAQNGSVTLSGPVLAHEEPMLLGCVRMIPGVTGVQNQLEAHETGDEVTALQGACRQRGSKQCSGNWSPSTRLIAATFGVGLMLRGSLQHFPRSCITGTAGLLLFTKALGAHGQHRSDSAKQSSPPKPSESKSAEPMFSG